jgi:hypothetical protein
MKSWSLADGAFMPPFGMYAVMANPALHPQALDGILVGVSWRDLVRHPRRLLRVFRESSHFFRD